MTDDSRHPDRYLIGGALPVVLVPARIARYLDRAVLGELARQVRGQIDPELDAVLHAVSTAGSVYAAHRDAAERGNAELPRPAPCAPSRHDSLDAQAVAQRLGCSTRNVRYLALRGRLPGQRVGDRWIFDPEDVAEYAGRRSA